jgi:hypothetical protein
MKLTKPQMAALKECAGKYGLDCQFKPSACRVLNGLGLIESKSERQWNNEFRAVWHITEKGKEVAK